MIPSWDTVAAGRAVPGANPGCVIPGYELVGCAGLGSSTSSFQNEGSAEVSAEKFRCRGAAGPPVHGVAAALDGISGEAIIPPVV